MKSYQKPICTLVDWQDDSVRTEGGDLFAVSDGLFSIGGDYSDQAVEWDDSWGESAQ